MTGRLPQTLRTRLHVEATTRCCPPPEHRDPIGEQTLRAAYGAHVADEHEGERRFGCRTCEHYLQALAAAERGAP